MLIAFIKRKAKLCSCWTQPNTQYIRARCFLEEMSHPGLVGFCLPIFKWRLQCWVSNFFHVSFPQINFESLKAQRYPKLRGLRGSRKVGERWLGKGLSDFLIHYPIGLVSNDMFISPIHHGVQRLPGKEITELSCMGFRGRHMIAKLKWEVGWFIIYGGHWPNIAA